MRQTLRAVKELQAGLSNQTQTGVDTQVRAITDQLHKETQSTTESMVKVAEVLGEKIDRLSVRVDEGYGNDVQVVIDRMSDAIQAMAVTPNRLSDRPLSQGVGARGPGASAPGPTISRGEPSPLPA